MACQSPDWKPRNKPKSILNEVFTLRISFHKLGILKELFSFETQFLIISTIETRDNETDS